MRDQAGIALQLGFDPAEHVRRLAERDAVPWHLEMAAAVRRGEPEAHAVRQPHWAAEALAALLEAAFNAARLSALAELHDRAVALVLPGNRHVAGVPALDRFLFGYPAAFPAARLLVNHAIALEEPGRPVRLAVRWRLAGTHDGFGAFGLASGAEVLVVGITQAELAGPRIRQAWWLVDELSLHRMIARRRG